MKLFEDSNVAGETPPYGTAIDKTLDDDPSEGDYKGYPNEVSTDTLTARTLYDAINGVYELEFRYNYADGPITADILARLDYLYIGAAVSNPSSPSDLFAMITSPAWGIRATNTTPSCCSIRFPNRHRCCSSARRDASAAFGVGAAAGLLR